MPLPELKSYSKEQWGQISELSPAIARYAQLIEKSAPNYEAELRLKRHQEWLRCALAVYFATTEPHEICRAWSDCADELLQAAWKQAGLDALPVVMAALGKHGSQELNLSSDVDVIYVCETPSDEILKRLKEFRRLVEDVNEFGFCFRLDHDIRPGGRMGPLLVNPQQMQNYFWTQAQPWERLAMVRFRVVAGPTSLKQEVESFVHAFTYRKHLDYSLLKDLSELRFKIHSHRATTTTGGLHLKQDHGTLRDIELFIHALQVLHGGRKTHLQTTSTSGAISQLKTAALLPNEDLDFLNATYWQLRDLENLIQIIDDQQTYLFDPARPELKSKLPVYKSVEAARDRVENIVQTVIGERRSTDLKVITTPWQAVEYLTQNQFSKDSIHSIGPQLFDLLGQVQGAEGSLFETLKLLIDDFIQIDIDRDLGLHRLLEFCQRNRLIKNFFVLMAQKPELRRDFSLILSASPEYGTLMIHRPEFLEDLISQNTQFTSTDEADLFHHLASRRQWTELVAALQFLKAKNLAQLSTRITKNADDTLIEIITSLFKSAGIDPFEILALGKWGGVELGLRSDLDFIMVTKDTPTETHIKLARRLISQLTEPHLGGSIYAIDLRLRPSGQAGPILVSQEKLRNFLQNEAEAWVRQSYLRARWIRKKAGYTDVFNFQKGLSENDIVQLNDIRNKLLTPPNELLNLKYEFGGLLHTELVIQTALLHKKQSAQGTTTEAMIQALSQDAKSDYAQIFAHYQQLREWEQMHQIFSGHSGHELRPQSESLTRMTKYLKTTNAHFVTLIRQRLLDNAALLKRVDPLSDNE